MAIRWMTRRVPVLARTAAAAVVVLTVAACADTPSVSGAPDDGGAIGTEELTTLVVGLIPIVDVAPVFVGIKQGIFAAHGLDIRPEMAEGGAAIVPAVTSDSYQVGFSNNVSLIIGVSRGLPVKVVAAASGISPDSNARPAEAGYCAVVAAPDSDIAGPADLAGETIAVNTVNNIGDVTIRAALEDDGVDPDTVSFIQMGFAEMPAALDSGSIEAGWLCEPFLTTVLDAGAVPLLDNYARTDPDLGVASYFVATSWAKANPDLVTAFAAAVRESMDYARANPDAVRAAILDYTRVDADTADRMTLPDYPTDFNEQSLQTLIDLSERDGLLGGPVTLDGLLQP